MNLYFYDGKKLNSEESLSKAIYATKLYALENGLEIEESLFENLEKTFHGKPYIRDIGIEFSISHSGSLWICAVSDRPVGADIQEVREVSYEKLAHRFFTPKEAHYVDLWGNEGFFDIWVRKEAYSKFKGTGFAAGHGFSSFSVLTKGGDLAESIGSDIASDSDIAFVHEVDMGYSIKCVVCSAKKETINLRAIEV